MIPHGGGDALFPENTMIAYERSLALGGDVVDIDVQMTADGVPIAFHDPSLDRTTNGTGAVARHTLAQVSTLDAGWDFSARGTHPFRGVGVRIPTVESILRKFPSRLTTLDLKDQRVAVVKPVCALLRRLRRTVNVYVGVDTAAQVRAFRASCPEVRTSATDDERQALRAARVTGDTSLPVTQIVSQPRFIGADGARRITSDYLAFSHARNVAVFTWVVDDPDDLRELIELGVDGIYTRRPDVMLRVLRELGRR